MTSRRPKVRHLTAYLFDAGVKEFADAIAAADAVEIAVDRSAGVDGVLYLRRTALNLPEWVEFVGPSLQPMPSPDWLASGGPSAVLLIREKKRRRIFAFTYGLGRLLLRLDRVEGDFGLKATINSVDPARLRSIDLHTLEDLPVHTRRQMSQSAPLETFGIDPARDMLRAVTGEPSDASLGSRLTGAMSLSLNVPVAFGDLPALCSRLYDASRARAYRDRFAWIDQLGLVRSASLIADLDGAAIKAINDPAQRQRFHLAIPEPLEWRDVSGYSYLKPDPAAKVQDFSVDAYLQARDGKRVEANHLKQDMIYALFGGEGAEGWSVRRCLLFEVQRGPRLYVLTQGQWFEVATAFVESVRRYISQVTTSTLPFPKAGSDEVEEKYNIRLAKSFKKRKMATGLLDKRIVKWIENESGIEVCDVLTHVGGRTAFVHVKRHARSGTLSHLFGQGLVSGEAFVQDADFRTKVRAEVEPPLRQHFGTARPDPSRYDIVYAIIAPGQRAFPDALPFFSKVTLMNASRRLLGLGYRVSIARVAVK